jgi:hypothetical protein
MNVDSLFSTILILSGLIILVSEYISRYTKLNGKWARVQSWVVSILLGIFGTWINIGIFGDMDWKGGALIGIISGLVANGVFTIDAIKKILETIGVRV